MRHALGDALRRLWRDDWVLGIGVAAGLALTGVRVVDSLSALVISLVDQPDYSDAEGLFAGPWTLVVGGRMLYLEPLAQSVLAFALVLLVGALVLRRSRPSPDDPGPTDA